MTSPDLLNKTLDTLESLVKQSIIQSYGIKLNVPPYSYHNPPAKQ